MSAQPVVSLAVTWRELGSQFSQGGRSQKAESLLIRWFDPLSILAQDTKPPTAPGAFAIDVLM